MEIARRHCFIANWWQFFRIPPESDNQPERRPRISHRRPRVVVSFCVIDVYMLSVSRSYAAVCPACACNDIACAYREFHSIGMRLRPARIIIRYAGISSRFGIREPRALLEETRAFRKDRSRDRQLPVFIFETIDACRFIQKELHRVVSREILESSE